MHLVSTVVILFLLPLVSGVVKFDQGDVRDPDTAPSTGPYKYPFLDPSLSWEDRTDDLVSRLTLEEIVPQTEALYGKATPAIPRLGINPYIWITECLRGEVGTNSTAFPQALGLASSFSESLIYEMAQAISYEVRAQWNINRKKGVYTTDHGLSCFSPVINIMRHPLWGRNQETYGEDPYLSGKLVQNYVRGLQGGHPRYVRANAGCKHFDVHGGPENIPVSRNSFDAKVSMRDWRMTFLPQFKMCVDAGTWNLMCSYNSINGVPSCANKKLLTDITRKEWGFKGYVISDAGAVNNIITQHKYLNNTADTAAACIKAGCNMELGSRVFDSTLDAMKKGKLTEEDIRNNAKPVFNMRLRLGEFDPEYLNPYNRIGPSYIQSQAHRDLAIKAAMQSFVLLKNNNNMLPFTTKNFKNIAVVGPFANVTDQLFGDYPSQTVPRYTKTVMQGLAQLGAPVQLGTGCDNTHCNTYKSDEVKAAVTGADLVVVAVGTGQAVECESNDRPDITLPGKQSQLLQDAVAAANGAPVLLLLFNAGPLDVAYAVNNKAIGAILECYFPAQSTGEALYRVLTSTGGDSVPAARLPVTWPQKVTDVPPITDYTMEGRTYRYYKAEPLFPFGYGLSYSRFSYKALTVSPAQIGPGESVTVSVIVQNTGKMDADEVVQAYFSYANNSVTVPKLQLGGFSRVSLKAGEAKTVAMEITAEQLSVWLSDSTGFGVLTGPVTVFAGGQQPNQKVQVPSNILKSSFTISI